MPYYDIYFEVYNKKMKTRVEANNVWDARAIVLKSVKIVKGVEIVDPVKEVSEQMFQNIKDIFGIK